MNEWTYKWLSAYTGWLTYWLNKHDCFIYIVVGVCAVVSVIVVHLLAVNALAKGIISACFSVSFFFFVFSLFFSYFFMAIE